MKKKRFNGFTVPNDWGGHTTMVEDKEEQVTSYINGSRQRERTCVEELLSLKPSDLLRLNHYHKNSMGKACPYDSITSYQVPPTTRGNSRWDLGGDTAKPYQFLSLASSCHVIFLHMPAPFPPSPWVEAARGPHQMQLLNLEPSSHQNHEPNKLLFFINYAALSILLQQH